MLKSKSFRTVFMIVAFALTLSMSIVLTQRIDVSAKAPQPSYSLSDLSEQTTRYLNYSCSPGGSGVYLGTNRPTWQMAGALLGFESEDPFDNEVTPFYLCSNNANNSCTYKIEALQGIKYTTKTYRFKDSRMNGDLSWLDNLDPSSGGGGYNTSIGGVSGISTNQFEAYARFGYALSEMGFDSIDADASNTWRLIGGTLMLFVYVLASALSSFFSLVIEILRFANPFNVFSATGFTGGGSGASGDIATGLSILSNMISGYYNILRDMGIGIIIPFTLVIALASVFWSPTMNGSIFVQKMKKFGIRFLFIAIGVPLACSLYDTVLSSVGDITAAANGTRIIQSTFFDFEKWAYNDFTVINGMSTSGSIAFDKSTGTIPNHTLLNIREECYHINSGGDTLGNYNVNNSESAVEFEYSLFNDTQFNIANDSSVISLLQRYARGDRVAAGAYASKWVADVGNDKSMYYMFAESADWKYFNPLNAAMVMANYNDGGGYSDRTVDAIGSSASGRFTNSTAWGGSKNPWVGTGLGAVVNGGVYNFNTSGMPPLAVYNYLSTEFNKEYIEVYAPDTSGSTFVKPQHYSVNLVGTSYTSILYYFDALVMIGSIVILGYAFGLGMMIGNFKAIFQLIPAVFSGMLGSMRGIATTIAIAIAMIANIILTGLLWGIASQIINLVYYLVEKPIVSFLSSLSGGIPVGIMYMVVLLISIIAVAGAVSKLLVWRKALVQSATEMFTAAVNKFCETNAVAPNLLGKDGTLKTAAATGLGLTMAGMNGAFDGLGERLGFKKSDSQGQGNISESILGKQDAEHNPFGVVGGDADANSSSISGDMTSDDSVYSDDGTLTDADGNPLTDVDGNSISTDEDGNLVDANGNPITDENGNPVSASGVHFDKNGNLVDSNGHAITDVNGNTLGTGVALSQHDGSVHKNSETGELTDSNGNTITDSEGNAITTDSEGYLTDSDGNRLTDSEGNPIKASSARVDGHGNLRDSHGNTVKSANGNTVGSGSPLGNNINRVSRGGNGSESVYKNASGNLTDAHGNELHDAAGSAMHVNEDGNIADSMGHEIKDANGDPIPADSVGINPDGSLTDADGNIITDENQMPISVADDGSSVNGAERADNTTDEAEEYLNSSAAQSSINAFMGVVPKSAQGSIGDVANGVSDVANSVSGRNTAGAHVQTSGQQAASEHTQVGSGFALSNGSVVNGIDMPSGAVESVATEQGIMPKEQAEAQGLTGMSGIYTSDGEFVPGQTTSSGNFVPGVTTQDGQFVPGVVQNGQFTPGGFDESGNFVAGVYTNDGFVAGSFDTSGKFVSTGASVPTSMNGKVAGGSVINNGNGNAVVTDGNGGSIPVVTNSNGDLGVVSGSSVLSAQTSQNGGLSLNTGDGGQISVGADSSGRMILGTNGVTASSQNGQIMLNTGTSSSIPVVSDSNGYVSVKGGDGGNISLIETSTGNLALATGDGSAIALDKTDSGQLVMRTASGEGVALTANSNGGLCAVDKNGSEVPISVYGGHLSMGSSGSNSVAITADENGNAMIGGNGTRGASAHIVSTSDGGFGVDGSSVRIQNASGGFNAVSSSGRVAPITASSNGTMNVGGQQVSHSGVGSIGVQNAGGTVGRVLSNTNTSTSGGYSTTITPWDNTEVKANPVNYTPANASAFSQSVRIAAAVAPVSVNGGSNQSVVVSQGSTPAQQTTTVRQAAATVVPMTNTAPNVKVSGVQVGNKSGYQDIAKTAQTVVQSITVAKAAIDVMEGNTSSMPTAVMGYQMLNNDRTQSTKTGLNRNVSNVNSRPKNQGNQASQYRMTNPRPSKNERDGFNNRH